MGTITQVIDHLRDLGYEAPGTLIPNSQRVTRFDRNGKKKNAWIILYENRHERTGEQYFHAVWGDFTIDNKALGSHSFIEGKQTREDKMRERRQLQECVERLERERKLLQEEASVEANRRWESSAQAGYTQYLADKTLDGLFGARVQGDNLVIPLRDVDGKIWSTQTIDAEGGKWFQADGRIDDCFHLIGDIGAEAFICEGYATSASVHAATGKPVVCAFNAGNLPKVAKALANKFKQTVFTICGDDDEAGRSAAMKAELLCRGTTVYPTVGKDFNDMAAEVGLDAVRELIDGGKATSRCEPFVAIGHDGMDVFYFYRTDSNTVIRIRNFTDADFFKLADLTYWETDYPPVQKQSLCNWMAAKNALIQQCAKVGNFDVNRIRGTGVWLDEKRVVVNLGRRLLVDGIDMAPHEIESAQVYTQSSKLIQVGRDSQDGVRLLDACKAVNWQHPNDALLLAGWLFVSRLGGVLPVRPHIWLTGGSGCGKSTVFEQIISKMLGVSQRTYLYYQGNTTEAAIRQEMRDCAIPVIFDEFEAGKNNQKAIAGALSLMRNTWSATAGKVAKGSPNGMSLNYQLAFCACVASIRVRLEEEADQNRFSVLELKPHGNDPALRKRLLEATANLPLAENLFARAINSQNELLKSYHEISNYIRMHALSAPRLGDQAGMLLAGAWMLTHDRAITAAEVPAFARGVVDSAVEDTPVEDHRACLDHLLTTRITVREGNGDRVTQDTLTIGKAIDNHHWHHELLGYGVKVDTNKQIVYVQTQHAELAKIYRDTLWAGAWGAALKRLTPTGKITKGVRFGESRRTYGTAAIPMTVLNT